MNKFRMALLASTLVVAGVASAQVQFNFSLNGSVPVSVQNAFQAAANQWSSRLNDAITVNVTIGWTAMGGGILGSAGSSSASFNYSDVRSALLGDATSADDVTATSNLSSNLSFITNNNSSQGGTYLDNNGSTNNTRVRMNIANARALGLWAASDNTNDVSITFNSNFAWDFDQSDGITAGQYDLIGVAAHEIGHGLGFVSGVDSLDGADGSQSEDAILLRPLDFYRYSSFNNSSVRDFTAGTRDKFFSIDGGATFGSQFSEGVSQGDGRQASHWKDNLGIGILDPTAAAGELLSISANDLQAFDVIGYDVVPEPATMAIFGLGLAALARPKRKSA